MSFGVYLYLQGVIREYGEKAHMSCLQRDNYVLHNFPQSRRVQKPRERTRARSGSGQGGRPPPLGARPGLETNPDSVSGLRSIDLNDQYKPHNQCRFDLTAQIHLKRLYNQGLSTPGGGEKRRNHYAEVAIKVRV